MAIRIGELSRRVGVSEQVLRAWEQHYGLLAPERTPTGYRLYSALDEMRVRTMMAHLDAGLSAAQAAAATLAADPTGSAPPEGTERDPATDADASGLLSEYLVRLRTTLDAFDEAGAHTVIDEMVETLSLTTVLRAGLVPYLSELGQRWVDGQASIAQEHFASNLLRGRLSGLARGWGLGSGPRVVLACPPGELHDLTLMVFGIVIARHGWRVTYLGIDTPVIDLRTTVGATEADLVVLAATNRRVFSAVETELAGLATEVPVLLGGAGATDAVALRVGAQVLAGDPVSAAERVARRDWVTA